MEKPTDRPLSTDGAFDYDIVERVVRQLQESHLHILETHVFSALPDALKTGSPYDEHTSILVPMTMLTDGERGFLILVHETSEYDAALEMADLVSRVVGTEPGDAFVVRAARMDDWAPCAWPGTLPLVEPARVRAVVERAYEDAFAGRGPIDHAAFLASFTPYGCAFRDERAIGDELRVFDSRWQRHAASRSVGVAKNRAERRWQSRRERRAARKRRARAK